MNAINLRLATEDDAQDLFDWRNDPTTREMSRKSDIVEWSDHSSWFSATLQNDDRLLLICVDSSTGANVGMVRFDIDGDKAEMSINIAPAMRGQGYAKPCLREALIYLFNANKSVKLISAGVKSTNAGSRKSFEGVGFIYQKTSDDMQLFEYERDQEQY